MRPVRLPTRARAGRRTRRDDLGLRESEDAGAAELTRKFEKPSSGKRASRFPAQLPGQSACAGNLMTMPDDRPQKLAAGPVAIVGQSGGIAMGDQAHAGEERGRTGSSSPGQRTGLTTAALHRLFAASAGVRAIVSYLEAVHDPGAFLAACRERARRQAGRRC